MFSKTRHHVVSPLLLAALLGCAIASLSGCSALQSDSSDGSAAPSMSFNSNPPFYPAGIKDVQIPGELTSNRDETLYTNTDSYAGGILAFEGRVEINSLNDFFVAAMANNGWKMVSNVRYRNVLLAFVKSNKSCMIGIYEGKLGAKTRVYVHLTEDIARANAAPAMSQPLR